MSQREVKKWKSLNFPCRVCKPTYKAYALLTHVESMYPFATSWKQKNLSFSDVFRSPKLKHRLNIIAFYIKFDKGLVILFLLIFPFTLLLYFNPDNTGLFEVSFLLTLYQYDFIQLLNNLFKVGWKRKNVDIICYMLTWLVNLQQELSKKWLQRDSTTT